MENSNEDHNENGRVDKKVDSNIIVEDREEHLNNGRTPSAYDKEPNFKLAISLEDLDRVDPIQRQKLLYHRLDLSDPIRMSSTSIEVGVLFTCSLLTAGTICDIIRSEDRKGGDSPTRVYLCRPKGNWSKVSSSAVFCVEVRGRWYLNPELFCTPIEQIPPRRQRLSFVD